MGSISTLGIIMAGWASNNKYALLGAFRTVAQMVSYEVPMVISLLIPVILAGSMGINSIVKAQSIPYILIAPLAALIFFLSAQAELGRAPFDLNEAESEIVAGYHIEYTGMKFGMFYAGELLHALTVGGLFSAFFLGGWRGPFVDQVPLLGLVYFFIKAFFMYWAIMWLKYSMPRIRIDHMLNLNWKLLTPLSLAVLVVTAVMQKLLTGAPLWLYLVVNLGANLIILWVTLSIMRRFFKVERKRVAEPRPYARPPASPIQETPALEGPASAQPTASSPAH
jgi:NADH-quinone oxidoreductase subunit H